VSFSPEGVSVEEASVEALLSVELVSPVEVEDVVPVDEVELLEQAASETAALAARIPARILFAFMLLFPFWSG